MNPLIDFLLARLAEDEHAAQDLLELATEVYDGRPARPAHNVCEGADAVFGAGRIDPGRLLSECEVKRRIIEVERTRSPEDCRPAASAAGTPTLRLLALPYANHPAYQEHWRP